MVATSLPNRTDGISPDAARREIDERLAQRLVSESALSEIAHVALAGVVGALAWSSVAHARVIAWVALVFAAAVSRALLRKRAVRGSVGPAARRRSIRVGVTLLALSWGIGLLGVGPQLPIESLAFITIVIAGLVSGATASLLADPPAFYLLLVLLLTPLSAAIALHSDVRLDTIGVLVVAMYGGAMSALYRRSHAALVEQLHAARHLEISARETSEARDAERYLVRIIEATTDHIGIAGTDGRLRYMNRAGREMLGIGPDEPLNGARITDIMPARLHEIVQREQIPAVMRDGRWMGETALLHRDGHEIPVSLVALAHRDASGNIESLSAIARDISSEVATRRALQSARDVAEQATAAKSAFLANTSHEVRTPLNGILGMVELLLDTELTPSQKRSAELIASSGESLLETINDLLDLSKIEAGQLDLESIAFDLHHVVHTSVRLLMPRAHAKEIELVSDVAPSVPQHVMGDPHRLRQVLSNLIGNAVKFTTKGDVVVSARVVIGEDMQHRVRIGVKDSGIGIAPGHMQRIFEPFRQADASTTREFGGTGLGLSIARRLIDLMDGTLAVESTAGIGSEFSFVVPFTGASTAQVTASVPTPVATLSLSGVRALVVDDHPTNRRVTSDMLRWAGFVVDDVESAPAAFEALRRSVIDRAAYKLVVSDVHMPGQSGFAFAEAVRADHTMRDVRIMLLTSAGQKGDGQRCKDLGVVAYMQKPVSRVELIEAATAALGAAPNVPDIAAQSLVTRHSIGEARRPVRILLAEDNRVNQEVAASMLRKRGHHVDIVVNGRLAVEAVKNDRAIDLVLMDMQMPELDGIGATQEIRALGFTELQIVALTANASSDEKERCLAAGMNGFLSKPFKSHELFAVVEGRS